MKQIRLRLCFVLIVGGLCLSSAAFAGARIAVIYPAVEQPYSKVFEQIITEIQQQRDFDVRTYPLHEKYDPATVNRWITEQNAQTLVALGQRGTDVVEVLDINIPIVIGAVLYTSRTLNQSVSGISLTPDPALLFKQLEKLAPDVKRIHVVYNPDRFQWLIDYAKQAAAKRGVQLVAKEARDLFSAAPLYRELLSVSQQGSDAIWLLQDSSTVGNSSILPLVLQVAWDKKLIVFSSNPSHVRRGALFSLYANQSALGQNIVQLVLSQTSNKSTPKGLLPLRDVHIAVNLRTAGHIGINIPYEQRRLFDTVYPKR